MTTLDDLDLFDAPTGTQPEPRPCRRHNWYPTPDGSEVCLRCTKVKDPATARRGKNNRSRGLTIQRAVLAEVGMEHIPGNGPADGRDSQFVAEVKSGPSWYSVRVEAELDNLPTAGNRTPIFVAASTPGPGKGRRRVYVIETLGDLVKRVGPHAQIAYWAPDWVATKDIGGASA